MRKWERKEEERHELGRGMRKKGGIRKRKWESKEKEKVGIRKMSGKGNWEGKVNEKDKERERKEMKRGVNKMKNIYGEKGEARHRKEGGVGRGGG
jgi:hypothetical protein